jgi:CheY-like chemotaxis protein
MPEPATRTVLLVEDDPVLCRALAAGLEAAGYETRVVHTAVAGLAQARDWRPDLVLLDLRLPDLDGPALLGRLAADPRTAGIPLVAMCREADPDSAGAARAAGAQAVLTAPFEVEEVRRTVAAQVARTGRPGRGSGWEGTIGQGISRLVHADLDAERVCRAVVDGAQELLDLAAASLWLVDGDELELRVETALFERLPRAHRRLRVGEGLVGAVALERRPITVDDAGQDPRVRNRALFEALGLRGFVAVPLLHEGRLLGVLSGARSAPGPFRPEDVPVLAALADHAAAVLAQARQLHESERRRRTAEALAALAAEVQRVLSVFQNRRWDSDFLGVRREIVAGRVGEVVELRSEMSRYRPEVRDRWRERAGPGSGVWYDLGPHLIDQALVLFGPPESVQVDLRVQRRGGSAIDWFHAILGYGPMRVILASSMLATDAPARFLVRGTKGSLTKRRGDVQEDQLLGGMKPGSPGWGLDPDPLVFAGGDEGAPMELAVPAGDYLAYYASIREAVRGEGELPVTPAEATTVMAVIEAGMRSSAEGRVIPLDRLALTEIRVQRLLEEGP